MSKTKEALLKMERLGLDPAKHTFADLMRLEDEIDDFVDDSDYWGRWAEWTDEALDAVERGGVL
jgi:hypothetical protein